MSERSRVLAVDVGGTAIKAVVSDADGATLAAEDRPTPVADGPDAVVEAIRSVAADVVARVGGVEAAGVVVPGDVDSAAGVARYAANLGWRDVALRDVLARALGVPVVLDHDVRAAALAERTVGVAVGEPDHLVVVIGTGIAAVSVAGGQVVRGARGLAGELGHVAVRPDGARCACGQRGCLETYASAAAIARRYERLSGVRRSSADVVAAVDDRAASTATGEAVDALAIALAAVVMLQDPEMIVIAGGLSEAGDALLEPLRRAVLQRVVWRDTPRIVRSGLGVRAGRVGAALLARAAADRVRGVSVS